MWPPSEEEEFSEAPAEDDSPGPPPLLVIIDSSIIIDIKIRVPVAEQWPIYNQMLVLLDDSRLAFPTQVAKELADLQFPDAPGTWCANAVSHVQFHPPSDATLAAVLPMVPDLVETNADPKHEKADPYIVAMASELMAQGFDVVVATEDRVDRLPLKIALTTACDRFGVVTWDFDVFVEWVKAQI